MYFLFSAAFLTAECLLLSVTALFLLQAVSTVGMLSKAFFQCDSISS